LAGSFNRDNAVLDLDVAARCHAEEAHDSCQAKAGAVVYPSRSIKRSSTTSNSLVANRVARNTRL
jgi:hypothetical protein